MEVVLKPFGDIVVQEDKYPSVPCVCTAAV